MRLSAIAIFLILLIPTTSRAGGSLCDTNETTVWSCFTSKKTYSLCASNGINSTSGYMQYRAGKIDEIEFRYPKGFKHPKGIFTLEVLNRDGRFNFKNGDYEYEITDQLIGQSYIRVNKKDRNIADIDCSHADPSIIDNSSLDLFQSLGLQIQ